MPYSKNKPLSYGLYGEKDFLLPDFLHCETMQYRSEKHNWTIQPHLHTHLFQMFLIESGKVSYTFEEGRYHVSSGSIITIPENILHGLEVSKDVIGMVLTLSSSFLETLFKSSHNVLIELGTTKVLTDLKDHKLFHLVRQLIYGLYEELKDDMPEKGLVLQGYLSLMLSNIYRLSIENSERTITTDNRNAQYFRSFQRSMKQSYTPRKTIIQYARELHITPVHLNRICQATVGKSTLQVVHDFLFLEAKKYLLYTDYSISEIAYRLNFEDPAYFSRFFSKLAGCAPKEFRKQ
ncbi:helix-turn-helix domain-containing protein [Chitinophagaceae bacterium LB-8]|uniref:Helix-turn-helix domain-containing protein n=1 Tax=Paraflavisolibacter caeni TaxID=2982496 RepID=A0A9X2XW75_9BACT|nr:helix-turn-helix domain-containing protein [Paraflavisolibacter caeni]MCU7549777.1 helix-turn-helix domain-containing protein [Paraflavisolibacter caeni]